MLLLLPVVGFAAEPLHIGEVHGLVETSTARSPGARSLGAGAFFGVRTEGQRFDHGARLSLLTGSTAPFAGDLRGQSRLWLSDPGAWASVALSYGVRADSEGFGPVGDLEVAWDVPLSHADAVHRLRIGGRLGVAGVQPEYAALAVGLAWGPPPSPPPEPEVPDARIWLPHPVCAWVHPDDLDAVLADLPPDKQPQIHTVPFPAPDVDVSGLDGAAPQPALLQGALLVVGRPGDRVVVGEQEVPAGADGVVQFAVAEGPVEAEVVGGGRRLHVHAAVSKGHGTWVRIDDPVPSNIEFDMGSEVLDAASKDRLAALVSNAGDWEFELQGGFSPEGEREANISLANRRSAMVRAALLELGLPEAQVRIVSAAVPEDATSAAARRVCTILPRSPGEVSP